MLNARKIQEFVMFISRLFLRYPREALCPFIYEYNISMYFVKSQSISRILSKIDVSMSSYGTSPLHLDLLSFLTGTKKELSLLLNLLCTETKASKGLLFENHIERRPSNCS